jgi:hypothetical protein
LFCPEHKYEGNRIIKYDSPELNQIVPPYSNFAYDVSIIKKVQDERGGFILHIDATVEEESDMVFVGMNSVNGWVLIGEYGNAIQRFIDAIAPEPPSP